jgi:hypothetical protein
MYILYKVRQYLNWGSARLRLPQRRSGEKKSGGRVIFLAELGKSFLVANVDRVGACSSTNQVTSEREERDLRVGAYFAYRVV